MAFAWLQRAVGGARAAEGAVPPTAAPAVTAPVLSALGDAVSSGAERASPPREGEPSARARCQQRTTRRSRTPPRTLLGAPAQARPSLCPPAARCSRTCASAAWSARPPAAAAPVDKRPHSAPLRLFQHARARQHVRVAHLRLRWGATGEQQPQRARRSSSVHALPPLHSRRTLPARPTTALPPYRSWRRVVHVRVRRAHRRGVSTGRLSVRNRRRRATPARSQVALALRCSR
jgi:hypothetical protein